MAKRLFGFIDETGILHDEQQRLFALGLLKIEHTCPIYQRFWNLKNLAQNRVKSEKGAFEFKFSSITQSNYRYYNKLIDIYFSFTDLEFCCLVFDKKNDKIQISKYFATTWQAYIFYSKILIENNIRQNENICVIADYLQKPRKSKLFYSQEVKKLPGVYNACMLESHASLFIQIVDVILGCVIRDYYRSLYPQKYVDQYKNKVSAYFKKKIKKTEMVGGFTVSEPNYFNVWEFTPKN